MHEKLHVSFRAAGCFCLLGDEVLIMQRHPQKSYGLHWAIPTGKLESGETPHECMVRELKEELDIDVNASALALIGDFVVEIDQLSRFEYFTFVLHLNKMPNLTPSPVEIHQLEWKPVDRIRKRKVVPYFYNTVNALIEWELEKSAQIAMFPESEANRVDRRKLRSYRNYRIQPKIKGPTVIRPSYPSSGTEFLW